MIVNIGFQILVLEHFNFLVIVNIGFQILMLFSNSMLMSVGWLDGKSQVEVGKKQTSRERGQALGLGIGLNVKKIYQMGKKIRQFQVPIRH